LKPEIPHLKPTSTCRGCATYEPGNLTREIFADNCRFTDPTVDVVGLTR
jgi:hypothetical protein